jgi:CDP-glucose 4,6-dehydratase
VVLITTDKVYANKEWIYPYRETDRLGGYDPYSASKAAAEIVIDSYCKSFFNTKDHAKHQKAIGIGRAGNVIGGGDWAKDRIIPDIIRALDKQKAITVRNPIAVRPWQHVIEPVSGYLYLGQKLSENPQKFHGAWNFGPLPEDNLTVGELVKIAIEHWGSGTFETPELKNQPHEAGLLRLDISKAIGELGWHPRWNAHTAIANTIDWYKAYTTAPAKIAQYTQQQINQYIG